MASGRSGAARQTTLLKTFDEATGRRLFAAGDGNRDDRLDLFEACAVLPTLRGAVDRDTFRRLDKDRDGYLEWPEFADHLKQVIEVRGRIRLGVGLPQEESEAAQPTLVSTAEAALSAAITTATPAAASAVSWLPGPLFLKVDKDGDGELGPREIGSVLKLAGLPPAAVARVSALDSDKNGRLTPKELSPAQALVKNLVVKGTVAAPAATPSAFATAAEGALDLNGDGALTTDELTIALRKVDPSLGRHSQALLAAVDGNRDQMLQPAELSRAGLQVVSER